MNSQNSIDLINHIIQPFQRSLDQALRVMDCSIDEERSLKIVADDTPSPIVNTANLSIPIRTTAGSEMPFSAPDRLDSKRHPESTKKSALTESPRLESRTDAARKNPATCPSEIAAIRLSDAAENLSPSPKTTPEAAPGGVETMAAALPVIEPNTANILSAKSAESGPDRIDARPHGIPLSNGSRSENPTDGDLSGIVPASDNRIPGSGTIEKLKSPDRTEFIGPNIQVTAPADKSTSLIPLKEPQNSTLPKTAPIADPSSTILAAPRPVRQAAATAAEGLEPVLDQAYGISQQAFESLTAPVPGEDEAPPATRVSNNFQVNVSMSGTNSTGTDQHEAIEEALVDILRLAARRHGLEV
jgi:hypothetical protein